MAEKSLTGREPKIYDVSLPIYPNMLTWPGNPTVSIELVRSIARGDSSNVSRLQLGSHSGTHVDAPRHFISDKAGIDSLKPEVLVGRCRLFHLPDVKSIDRRTLESLTLSGVTRVLFHTRNSKLLKLDQVDLEFTFVAADAAAYLLEKGIKLVGIDYLSIDQASNKARPTHHTLLKAGIVIVEGLDLEAVPEGDYELMCLPLRIKDADGAPARVFLQEVR